MRGIGAVYSPSFLAAEAIKTKKLLPILSEWRSEAIAVRAVYPSQKFLAAKVRLAVDFLAKGCGLRVKFSEKMISRETGSQFAPCPAM